MEKEAKLQEKSQYFHVVNVVGQTYSLRLKWQKGKIVYKQILKTEVPANVNNVDVFYFIEELQQSEAGCFWRTRICVYISEKSQNMTSSQSAYPLEPDWFISEPILSTDIS